MKTFPTTAIVLALLLVPGAVLAQSNDTDGDGVPDIAEPLLHTDPGSPDTDGDGIGDLQDDAPIIAPTPIVAGGAPAPFHIIEVLVENNIDPVAHRDAPDHLEIAVVNDGTTDLSGFTLFYTMTDQDSGVHEAYIAHPDTVVPAGGEARFHVDDSGADGHLRANPNSIYVTSVAGKDVTVALQLDGYAAATMTIQKDPGGAEQAD
ncbi:hypothetical protein [Nioella nitratireducens]|uniref:hypothetical protein n=1 Tax=Nioella nitratireducens TaxID=1287720 RepID=UPI0008FD6013|nr:hypothetical protein [Nioella nitratireducens]